MNTRPNKPLPPHHPLARLRHHVSGAIARGETEAITEQPSSISPVIDSYRSVAAGLPADTLLFVRMGDFWEAFDEMARTVCRELRVTLTQRKGVPNMGIPVYSFPSICRELEAKGYEIQTRGAR